MLGTVALSQPVPAPAALYLKDRQQPDGGWEWDAGFGADSNTTALAVQALLAAGEAASSTAVVDALSYLEAAQNDDAGFPYDPDSAWGTASDANSTALVLQALLAAGQAPAGARWTAYTGGITPTNPISYLLGVQLADGSFAWQAGVPGDRQAATRQVIPALLGRSLPLQAAALEPCRAVYLPEILK
jgi:squalene cyclase